LPIIPTNQSSDKSFNSGIFKMREFLLPDPISRKPRLYVMQSCPNINREFNMWQFKTRTKTDEESLREHTQTVNKEWLDCVRYMVMAEQTVSGGSAITCADDGERDSITGW
jgi:hypothetical protein